MRCALFLFLLIICAKVQAQNDTITLKNNDVLVGELKSLSKAVVIFKTVYSDKDFRIDYNDVIALDLNKLNVIDLAGGEHYVGMIKTNGEGKYVITDKEGSQQVVEVKDVVRLAEINDNFWGKFTGSFDFGYDLAKSNNSQQISFAGTLKYSSERWNIKTASNILRSTQDNTDEIQRLEWTIESNKFLSNRWYTAASVSYLESTEQGIRGRTSPELSFGKFLVSSNKLYWMAGAGLSYNIETYYDSELDKNSLELLIGTQFEIFNFEDLSFSTAAVGYPSLSEKGRFRLDYDFTLKYDLPLDFYIKASLSLNYDNQPVEAGNTTDYVFSTGFGWELK